MHIWARKIVALSFIGLVILGNIWLMSMFTGKETPSWTAYAFFVCLSTCFIGFLGLIPGWIKGE